LLIRGRSKRPIGAKTELRRGNDSAFALAGWEFRVADQNVAGLFFAGKQFNRNEFQNRREKEGREDVA